MGYRRYFKPRYIARKTIESAAAAAGTLAASGLGPTGAFIAGEAARSAASHVANMIPRARRPANNTVNRRMISGHGDYFQQGARVIRRFRRRINRGLTPAGSNPVMVAGKNNSVRVRRTEYITDISATAAGAFANNTFSINPGLPLQAGGFSQWLPCIASGFDSWRAHSMVFEYRTLTGAISTSTILGSVALGVQYNNEDSLWTQKVDVLNSEFAISCPPSQNALLTVECKKQQQKYKEWFTRNGSLGSNDDINLYDLGILQVSTNNVASTGVQGELWVSYDISFDKPQTPFPLALAAHYRNNGITASNASAGYTNALPLGVTKGTNSKMNFGTWFPVDGSNIPLTFTSTTISFPPLMNQGTFFFLITWSGTSTASLSGPGLTPTNMNTVNCILDPRDANNQLNTLSNNTLTSTTYFMLYFLTITGAGAVITLGTGPTLPTVGLDIDLSLIQISPSAYVNGQ